MAKAGSTISAAILLLLIGSAAEAQGAEESGPSAVLSAAARPPQGAPHARRPSYVSGGWQCPPGYVWRNAGRTDWLCVEPQEADRVQQENERARDNWIGQDRARRCRPGLVERQAFSGDVACVEPERRAAIRQMNMALYTVR